MFSVCVGDESIIQRDTFARTAVWFGGFIFGLKCWTWRRRVCGLRGRRWCRCTAGWRFSYRRSLGIKCDRTSKAFSSCRSFSAGCRTCMWGGRRFGPRSRSRCCRGRSGIFSPFAASGPAVCAATLQSGVFTFILLGWGWVVAGLGRVSVINKSSCRRRRTWTRSGRTACVACGLWWLRCAWTRCLGSVRLFCLILKPSGSW